MNTSALIVDTIARRRWRASLVSMTVAALLPSSSHAQLALPGCPLAPNEPETRDCSPPPSPHKPIRFQGDHSGFVRVRKSVYELTPYEIDRLRRAFGALRKLSVDDPTDPRGWLMQANVHCWHCAGMAPPEGAGVDVHGHYWFLPWHRAYLYFLEKIMGELIDEPDFALPYWDWDTPGHRLFPPPYTTPGDVASNPLFDPTRRPSGSCLFLQHVGPQAVERVMTLTSWDSFMGKAAPAQPAGPVDPLGPQGNAGLLEFTIHNVVHGTTPDRPAEPRPERCGAPNMGIFSVSAQDPIFFAHHANVDRLWETWWRAGGEQRLPPDDRWRQKTYRFYDQHRHLVEISVEQVIESAWSLGYAYSPPSAGGADTCPPDPQPPAAAGMALFAPSMAAIEVRPGAAHLLTSVPETVIARVRDVTPSAAFLGPAAAPIAPRREPRLRIDGVTLPPGHTATVRVLLSDPSANALMSSAPVDETYFSIIPHHSHHTSVQNIEIPLRPQAEQLLLPPTAASLASGYVAEPSLLVTLVPTTPETVPLAAAIGAYGAPVVDTTAITYRDIYITR